MTYLLVHVGGMRWAEIVSANEFDWDSFFEPQGPRISTSIIPPFSKSYRRTVVELVAT